MSYCRFSSDDWRCDLYCYEDAEGGWTTHVATCRVPEDTPRCPPLDATPEWLALHRAQLAYLETAEKTRINLPYDGQMFSDPTLADFRQRLIGLRAVGYLFPDWVLEDVDREIADANACSETRVTN